MSDTPETDAQQLVHSVNGAKLHCVDVEFAKQLERERDEARIMTAQANNMASYYYRLMRTYKDWAFGNKSNC